MIIAFSAKLLIYYFLNSSPCTSMFAAGSRLLHCLRWCYHQYLQISRRVLNQKVKAVLQRKLNLLRFNSVIKERQGCLLSVYTLICLDSRLQTRKIFSLNMWKQFG